MKTAPVSLLVAALAGCATSSAPDWIMNPTADGGAFAATECVKDSGNLSLDRQMAVAKARAEIAKQVELRVAAMDKTYTRLSEEASEGVQKEEESASSSKSLNTAFESVSKQVAEQTLSGLSPSRVEYVELNDARNLCAMIAIDKSQTRQVYDQAVLASGAKVSPQASAELYKDFSAPKE